MSSSQTLHLRLQDATVEVERLGELFLINRQQIVATDKARHGTREALTALRKHHADGKAWISTCSGSFERCGKDQAVERLQQEAARLETVMEELRQQQKQLLAQLADKGATPQGLEDGMMRALLHLRG